ncbi:MAG TPA: hypothetical protein VG826_01990 [Pirellulales bacterium]|nr:hypothetical protein [Pirellulales bacterium]
MHKEIRGLFLGRGFWAALLIASFLSGYSYCQAVKLYSQASQAAQNSPELGRGLSPLDGILVPTFGGLYLISSLLYPFVVIRTIWAEKQTGGLQLLLQLPYSLGEVIAAKLAAAVVAWSMLALPCLAALALWTMQGGHLAGWETANLVLGHFLFALVTAGISLVAAATTESSASASIAAIAVMSGFWVLDFASTGEDGLLKELSALSLTRELKSFESGLFSLNVVVGSLSAAAGLSALAGMWLRPDWSRPRKMVISVLVIALTVLVIAATAQIRFYRDAAEDRRNSFAPADESLLRTIGGRLVIRVFLAPSDPRAYDLERSVLAKLRRTMPRVSIAYQDMGATPFFAGGSDEYGKVIYSYDGRQAMSRSTSAEEALNIVFGLAGLARKPEERSASSYPGYPLVVGSRPAEIVFYYLMPAAVLCYWTLAAGGWRTATQAPRPSSSNDRRNP